MHGYRDHCIRKAYSSTPLYCPYSTYQLLCPYCGYRQKAEEYPSQYQKRLQNSPPDYIPKMSTLASSIESKNFTCP